MSDERGFELNVADTPHVFLQWKGTNACFDFHCDCGALTHFDGYFAYVVQCGACGLKWQMPSILFPRRYKGDVRPVVTEVEENTLDPAEEPKP